MGNNDKMVETKFVQIGNQYYCAYCGAKVRRELRIKSHHNNRVDCCDCSCDGAQKGQRLLHEIQELEEQKEALVMDLKSLENNPDVLKKFDRLRYLLEDEKNRRAHHQPPL